LVKAFLLMLLAAVLVFLIVPFAIVGQMLRFLVMKKPLTELWWDIAIGLDQLGGAILYGEPDWTVSSRTYWLRKRGNRYAAAFEHVIDFILGRGHCQNAYKHEFGEMDVDR